MSDAVSVDSLDDEGLGDEGLDVELHATRALEEEADFVPVPERPAVTYDSDSDDDDMGTMYHRPMSEKEEAKALFGAAAEGGREGKEFEGDFKWDGFSDMQTLMDANAGLIMQLDAKEEELERMRTLLDAVTPAPGVDVEAMRAALAGEGGDAAEGLLEVDPRDLKVVQLAKKSRALTVALEKEKSRVLTLATELKELRASGGGGDGATSEGKSSTSSPSTSTRRRGSPKRRAKEADTTEEEGESAALPTAKERALSNKVQELRLKLAKLQAELRRALTVLSREVGDGVDVRELLEDGSTWRGRAQKLTMLKAKMRRLEAELREAKGTAGFKSSSDVDARAREHLMKKEAENREKADALAKRYAELEEEIAAAQQKLGAAKARVKVLEKDNRKMRGQMKVVLEKAATDDRLVDRLRSEMIADKRRAKAAAAAMERMRAEAPSGEALAGVQKLNADQARQLEEQERMILELQTQVRNLQAHSREAGGAAEMEVTELRSKLRLMSVEMEKRSELLDIRKRELVESQQFAEELLARNREVEAECGEFERQVVSLTKGSVPPPMPPSYEVEAMKDDIELRDRELQSLRATYEVNMENRDREIASLRRMLQEYKATFKKELQEMKEAAARQSRKAAAADGGASELEMDLEELRLENAALREELAEMRSHVGALRTASRGSSRGGSRRGRSRG